MTHDADIVTVAEMAEVDRLALAAGTPGLVLMDRAGARSPTDASRCCARPGAGASWSCVVLATTAATVSWRPTCFASGVTASRSPQRVTRPP